MKPRGGETWRVQSKDYERLRSGVAKHNAGKNVVISYCPDDHSVVEQEYWTHNQMKGIWNDELAYRVITPQEEKLEREARKRALERNLVL